MPRVLVGIAPPLLMVVKKFAAGINALIFPGLLGYTLCNDNLRYSVTGETEAVR